MKMNKTYYIKNNNFYIVNIVFLVVVLFCVYAFADELPPLNLPAMPETSKSESSEISKDLEMLTIDKDKQSVSNFVDAIESGKKDTSQVPVVPQMPTPPIASEQNNQANKETPVSPTVPTPPASPLPNLKQLEDSKLPRNFNANQVKLPETSDKPETPKEEVADKAKNILGNITKDLGEKAKKLGDDIKEKTGIADNERNIEAFNDIPNSQIKSLLVFYEDDEPLDPQKELSADQKVQLKREQEDEKLIARRGEDVEEFLSLNFKTATPSYKLRFAHLSKDNKHLAPILYEEDLNDAAFAIIEIDDRPTIIRALIERDSYRNYAQTLKDDKGNNLLLKSVMYNRNNTARMLLAKGVNPNIGNINNLKPLHAAAYSGNIEMVRALLIKDARLYDKDNTGRTPVDYALQGKYMFVLDLMHGVNYYDQYISLNKFAKRNMYYLLRPDLMYTLYFFSNPSEYGANN